ncbi:hypothetical protein [Kitasatospora sp. NPDC048407]|uniref:hypothetical protein n=1 Tax=Kitasatospora sp. NPDC048407 TaxID=3364051 RepID=UPI00371643F5
MASVRRADRQRKPLINRRNDRTILMFPWRGRWQTLTLTDCAVSLAVLAFVALPAAILVLIRELDPEQASRAVAALAVLISAVGGFRTAGRRRRR